MDHTSKLHLDTQHKTSQILLSMKSSTFTRSLTYVTLRMMTTSIEHTHIMTLSFDNMTIPSLEDLRLKAYHPKNAIPFLIRFFSTVMVIIIIIAMIISYLKCIQKYRCYKQEESYSPADQENKFDDITKELKEMEVDYAGHAPVIPPK